MWKKREILFFHAAIFFWKVLQLYRQNGGFGLLKKNYTTPFFLYIYTFYSLENRLFCMVTQLYLFSIHFFLIGVREERVCVCVFFSVELCQCVFVWLCLLYISLFFLLQYFLSFFFWFSPLALRKENSIAILVFCFFFMFNVLPSKANAAIGRGKQTMDTKVCVCVSVCLFVCAVNKRSWMSVTITSVKLC